MVRKVSALVNSEPIPKSWGLKAGELAMGEIAVDHKVPFTHIHTYLRVFRQGGNWRIQTKLW